jgi:hypothetical protein
METERLLSDEIIRVPRWWIDQLLQKAQAATSNETDDVILVWVLQDLVRHAKTIEVLLDKKEGK